MALSVQLLNGVQATQSIQGLTPSNNITNKPEQKLLSAVSEGQMSLAEAANAIKTVKLTKTPKKYLQAIVDTANRYLALKGNKVCDAVSAACKFVKDIAEGKRVINFDKLKNNPKGLRYQIKGNNGKKYGIWIVMQKNNKPNVIGFEPVNQKVLNDFLKGKNPPIKALRDCGGMWIESLQYLKDLAGFSKKH